MVANGRRRLSLFPSATYKPVRQLHPSERRYSLEILLSGQQMKMLHLRRPRPDGELGAQRGRPICGLVPPCRPRGYWSAPPPETRSRWLQTAHEKESINAV